MSRRNPVWSEEELVLALNEYFSHDVSWFNSGKESMKELSTLSQILLGLDIYPFNVRIPGQYRTPDAVDAKMQNFKSFDPNYKKTGKGLTHSGKKDGVFFQTYYGDREKLRQKCCDVIYNHYKGEMTEDIREYLELRIGVKVPESTKDTFREELNVRLNDLKKMAMQAEDDQLANIINKSCEDIKSVYEKGSKEKEKQNSRIDTEIIITDHAGINWKLNIPSTNYREKIGIHVKRIMDQLSEKNLLTKDDLDDCCDLKWSKSRMNLTVPMLKAYTGDLPVSKEKVDSNGHIRYWNKVYNFGEFGNYLVTKEWFEKGKSRHLFDNWYRKVISNYLSIDVEKMVAIFKEIQAIDKENKPVEKETLCNIYGIDDSDGLFEKLEMIGLLRQFKNRNFYFVDDYDILYDVLGD